MNKLFTPVKILIWDIDGTLFKLNPELVHEVRESEYHAIMKHTGCTHEKAVEEFHKLYKVTIQSATAVVAAVCHIPVVTAALESENYYDRREYLHPDTRLIEMFGKLKRFRHFILANGTTAKLKETLEFLGIPVDAFEEIVTAEIVGVTKPNPKGFNYILGKTGLPPNAHMMIGDRELVDLAPAKTLGMHTCLVWSHTPSVIADITLPTVYDVVNILRQ